MPGSGEIARLLVALGVFLVVLGLAVGALGRFINVGRLPGDILIRKGDFTFHFPIMTCLVLSLALTILAWVFRRR